MNNDRKPAVGGKAAALARITSETSLAVPRWTTLEATHFDDWLAPARDEMERRVRHGSHDPRACARELHALAAALPFGPAHCGALLERLNAFPDTTLLAVRSSALTEDLPDNAFAGLFESELAVRRSDVTAALRTVWLSAFSERAILYQLQRGFAPHRVSMGVVVQEMVPARAAGVLFTVNPNGNADEMLLSAVPGLGEGVVGEAVASDLWRIPRDGKKEPLHTPAVRDAQVVPRGEGRSGVHRVACSSTEPLLGRDQIEALRRAGLALQRLFGGPQDIEWAIDEEARLWILQSRAVTTLPRGPWILFDNTNIVENYPGLTTPLTFSWVRRSYTGTFSAAWKALGSLPRPGERSPLPRLVGYIDGRIFYNVASIIEAFSLLFGARPFLRSWEENLGIPIETVTGHALPRHPWPRRLFRASRTLATHLRCLFTMERLMERLKGDVAGWEKRAQALAPNDAFGAWQLVEELQKTIFESFYPTLLNDAHAFLFSSVAKAILRRAGLAAESESVARMLVGEGTLESMEPALSALAMARMVREHPDVRSLLERLLETTPSEELLGALGRDEALADLARSVDEHIRRYGFRKAEELKLESPSLAMNPRPLLDHVLRLASGVAHEVGVREAQDARAVLLNIRNPLLRLVAEGCLRLARRGVRMREVGRLERGRIFDVGRRALLVCGRGLADAGVIARQDDVFFLTLEEVEGWLYGLLPSGNLGKAVVQRREEWNIWTQNPRAGRMHCVGSPYARAPEPLEELGVCGALLTGVSSTPGNVEGEVVTATQVVEASVDLKGKILVAETTDPGWVFYLPLLQGLVIERGSPLSHLAIVAREFGVPTVVNVPDATRLLRAGERVRLDATRGTIAKISE